MFNYFHHQGKASDLCTDLATRYPALRRIDGGRNKTPNLREAYSTVGRRPDTSDRRGRHNLVQKCTNPESTWVQ